MRTATRRTLFSVEISIHVQEAVVNLASRNKGERGQTLFRRVSTRPEIIRQLAFRTLFIVFSLAVMMAVGAHRVLWCRY